MPFRVLILGGRSPVTYARLRDAIDAALANRLPDVVLVTLGGPGVPALAASYAKARGLELVTITPDHDRHRGNARGKQVEVAASLADAVVLVWDGTAADDDFLRAAAAKGIPVRVLRPGTRRREPVEPPRPRLKGMLPD